MNDQVIIAVANAITAQAETLKALIDALPKETKVAVEKRVTKATTTNTPIASVETVTPAVVEAPTPVVVETTTQPVAVPTTNTMPPAPFPTQPVAPAPAPIQAVPAMVAPAPVAPAPATVSPSNVPFTDNKGMLAWIMGKYQALGPEKGALIQNVLNSIGVKNINDVKPEQYGALVSGVEAL